MARRAARRELEQLSEEAFGLIDGAPYGCARQCTVYGPAERFGQLVGKEAPDDLRNLGGLRFVQIGL